MKKQKIPEDLFLALAATDELANEESEEAGLSMLKDAISFYNEEHGTSFDEHDTVLMYLRKNRR